MKELASLRVDKEREMCYYGVIVKREAGIVLDLAEEKETPFPTIRQAVNRSLSSDDAEGMFNNAVDYLLSFGIAPTAAQIQEIQNAIPDMERLTVFITDQETAARNRYILAFLLGKGMEDSLCTYINSMKCPPDCELFNLNLSVIIANLPTLRKTSTEKLTHDFWKTARDAASKKFPCSVFYLACYYEFMFGNKPLIKTEIAQRVNLLLRILNKDPDWIDARIKLAEIYENQEQWGKAFESYEYALRSWKKPSARLFFQLAWCADKQKKTWTAIQYYRKCVEINPQTPFAYNNLGYDLYRAREYKEAEIALNHALEVENGKDKRYPCRNLFDVYTKTSDKSALKELVQDYPEFFNTKHYREKYLKLTGELFEPAAKTRKTVNANMTEDKKMDTDISSWLEQTAENEYAGTLRVAGERSGIHLYPHQTEAVQKLDAWTRRSPSGAGLLVLPTGGGKTLTATYWIMRDILNQGGKVLWIAHRQELLNQSLASFQRVCYQELSSRKSAYQYRIVSGEHDKAVHIRPEDDIIIASKSSLARNLEYLRKNWIDRNQGKICMVIDEAHHAAAREYRDLINAVEQSAGRLRLLGLTATPFRTAEKEHGLLKKVFQDDILYKIDLRTLIERGILSEPEFQPVKTNVNMAALFHAGDADEVLRRIVQEKGFDLDGPGSLSQKAAKLIAEHRERNRLIVDTWLKYRETYGKTLVFALNQDMAIALNSLFQDSGVRSDYVISGTKAAITGASQSGRNGEVIDRFRKGELEVLVNVNILTEGTDLPDVQTVFLTRPTKSTILMTQMIGRALRGEKAGGTPKAYIVSFVDDWQERIAWVNPEKLFIDTNTDFDDKTAETRKNAMRLVSIAKIEEFTRLANETLDKRLTDEFTFLERIPVGFYQFFYQPDGEEEDRNCTILVYDCMTNAYQAMMAWLQERSPSDITDIEAAADHIDATLFGERERLLGYYRQDVVDILTFYCQTGEIPQWVLLEERTEYDVGVLAQKVISERMDMITLDDFFTAEWERADGKWSSFFGYQNIEALSKAVNHECRKILHPERYSKPVGHPVSEKEIIQVRDLSMGAIQNRYPELYEKLRKMVYKKYQDEDGFYHSASSDFKSKNPLDFQIDHIKPMQHGGLTVPDNLQLLTVQENAAKGEQWD